MSRVRNKDTRPELLLRKTLFQRGLRYRKNVASLPGTPDIVFPAARVAVFVDGEFWHGYQLNRWRHKLTDWWLKKIEGNRARDRRLRRQLRRRGWVVIRVWQRRIFSSVETAADIIETAVRHAARN